MFKFKFSDEDDKNVQEEKVLEWRKSEEIVFRENLPFKDSFKEEHIKSIKLLNITLKYLVHSGVLEILTKINDFKDSSILRAEQDHSDLLPAIYEGKFWSNFLHSLYCSLFAGGLKVWECTYDILNHLNQNIFDLNNKTCLDLGCGSGMIGIYCLLQGAVCTFQDYNVEVIKCLTMPNVILNQCNIDNCKFYSGDWGSLSDILDNQSNKFDYIFTSETIYNVENYQKLCNIFEHLLKKSGTILLAAKSYYFGVGGGIAAFQKYLDGTKLFKYETAWENTEGVKRSILKITFI